MMSNHYRVGLLLLLLGEGADAAAAPTMSTQAVAKRLGGLSPKVQAQVAQGQAALSEKRFGEAQQAFTNAYRQSPRASMLLSLARVAVGEGRALDSIDLYRRYLADPTREPDEAASKEAAQAVLAEPPEAGSVNVQGDNGMLVTVDGLLRGSVPLAQPVLLSPGKHTVTMELGGSKREQVLTVQHGRLLELRINQRAGSVLISKLPALLSLSDWGKVPVEAQQPLRGAQEKGARQQTMALMPVAAALANLPTAKDCLETAPCQQLLLKKNELEYALRSQVEYQSSPSAPPGAQAASAPSSLPAPAIGSYRMTLSLLYAELPEPASQQQRTCEACTPEQAGALYLTALGQLLKDGLTRKHGILTLSSEPPGAQVYLGQVLLGITPLAKPMWAGQYDLTLKRPGYEVVDRSLSVDAETPAEAVTLREIAEPVVPKTIVYRTVREPRPRWRLVSGGVSLGAGALLLSIGLPLLGLHGKCYNPLTINGVMQTAAGLDDSLNSTPLCAQLWNTGAVGGFISVLGLAGVTSGTIMLSLPGEKKTIREEQ